MAPPTKTAKHDRDDDAATDVGERELHAYEISGIVSSPGTSFDTRSAFISDLWNDVGPRLSGSYA